MCQYQGIFERYEKKYLVNEKQYKELTILLRDQMESDRFGRSTICNIYFDTPTHQLIRNSLERPIYKEKLRLRSYGVPKAEEIVFAELKKKYQGIVYKRRVDMKLYEAENYLYYQKPAAKESQITKEIDWFLFYYKEIIPSMYISYERIALSGIEDFNLRITFDKNILWREEELYLSNEVWGQELLEKGQRLMEIKIPGVIPLWLVKILDKLKIYPISMSKYGKGYLLSQKRKEKGRIICA